MSNPWFRLYTEIVDDEKLRLLAFEDRWHFIALLCCKGKGILDESNPSLMRRKVAVKLGLDARELDEVARRLAEVELINADTLQPIAWDRRQFSSDQDPTRNERQQRYRKKQKVNCGNGSVTHDKRTHNGSVTQEERPPDTDTDTDTEEEKEKKSKSVVSQGGMGGETTTDDGRRTTDDRLDFFVLTPERKARARDAGITDDTWINEQTTEFIKRNNGKPIRDPEKALMNWLVAGWQNGIRRVQPMQVRIPDRETYQTHGRQVI